MKGQIIYVPSHSKSIAQAEEAERSSKIFSGWDLKLTSGVTPKTLNKVDESQRSVPMIENSRLINFKSENENRFYTKLSCVMNHVNFWKEVVEKDEPMAFIEHDAIFISSWRDHDFDEYLILNAEYVFAPPNKLNISQLRGYKWQGQGVENLPSDYPLVYYRENEWKGSFMVPGTGAYALTPKGAKKMLKVAERNLDQSDFILNSSNVNIQYLLPSPIKFNTINLSTSYGV